MSTRRRMTAPQRREAILAAAEDVFAARGYHGTSIDDVAQAAGISKALIYEHFEGKRDLHASLLERHAGELFERLRANATAGREGAERLRGGVDAFFSFVEERREAWRVLFRDSADPELSDVIDRLQSQAANVIVAIGAEDPAGRPRGDALARELYAQQLSGAVQSLANWWHSHQDVPREVLVDRVMDFAWIGLERLREE